MQPGPKIRNRAGEKIQNGFSTPTVQSEFFAKNRVSGKYCEIQSNTERQRNRGQRKPEWVGVCRFVCIVKVKYDYSSETANIHLLRCSKFFKLNVRLKYGGNTVEIQLKYGFLQKMYCLVRNMHCATI